MTEYLVSLSLLTVVILLLRGIFRKRVSPRVIYALWLAAVIRLCLPFPIFEMEVELPDGADYEALTDSAYTEADAHHVDEEYLPDTSETVLTAYVSPTAALESSDNHDTEAAVSTADVEPLTVTEPAEPSHPSGLAVRGDLETVAVTVWGIGSAVLALWFIITGCRFRCRLTADRRLFDTVGRTKVYISEAAGSPCLAGFIPSVYITPEAAKSDSLTLVLTHELTHLRHGDHIWAVIRTLALIVHWWNPLVWAAAAISRQDAELACDDAVSARLSREGRLEYAHIIVNAIPQKHSHAVGFGSAPMKERIVMLTKKRKNSIVCGILAVVLAVGASGGAFTHVSASSAYCGINAQSTEIAQTVDKNLDIIINGMVYSSEEAYFKAHPEAVAEIVALGEAAVPYLKSVGQRYSDYGRHSTEQIRCFLAMAAAYKISPDTYDVISRSPNGRYEFRAQVSTFFTLADSSLGVEYDSVTVTNTRTGKQIVSYSADGEKYYGIDPVWSSNSKYVVFGLYGADSGRLLKCVDTDSESLVYWPHDTVYTEATAGIDGEVELVKLDTAFREWSNRRDAVADVTMEVRINGEKAYISGEYTYNIRNRRVKNLNFGEPICADTHIESVIDENLAILISDKATDGYTTEKQFIDAHPEAFSEIVALGEDALPYLNEVIERSPVSFGCAHGTYTDGYKRSIMAMAAAYEISPELYDLIYPSPDGEYVLRASVDSLYGLGDPFTGIRYTVRLIEAETGAVLASSSGNSNLMSVKWSDDSRYAAVMERLGSNRMDSQIIVYDTQNECTIPMPYDTVVTQAVKEIAPLKMVAFDLRFGGWDSEDVIKIVIDVKTGTVSEMRAITGWYTYDLAERKIVNIKLEFDSPDSMSTIIDLCLDEIVSKNIGKYGSLLNTEWNEQDYIAASPAEFAMIQSLGEAALPYLEEIGDTYLNYRSNDSKQARGLMAKAAIHAIYPSYYDNTWTSPNGKYAVSATAVDLFDLSAPSGSRSIGYELSVVDGVSGETIVTADKEFAYTCNPVNIEIDSSTTASAISTWTPVSWLGSGKYAAVTCGIDGQYVTTDVFDIEAAEFITLPTKEELESLIGKKMTKYSDISGSTFDRAHFLFYSWRNSNAVQIRIILKSQNGTFINAGHYTYDLVKREVINIVYWQ